MLNLERISKSEWAAITGCSVEELQEDFVKLVRCFHADDDSAVAGVEYCDGTYGCFGCGKDIDDLTFEQMVDCIEAGK